MVSPVEAFTGCKVDYKTDLRVGFGDYVEAYDPKADNSLRPRTQAAIALMPVGNSMGSVHILSLDSGKIFRRDHFTPLPMTDNV